jgi:hypothetical protein
MLQTQDAQRTDVVNNRRPTPDEQDSSTVLADAFGCEEEDGETFVDHLRELEGFEMDD